MEQVLKFQPIKPNSEEMLRVPKYGTGTMGYLVTYNSHEDTNFIKVSEFGINALNDLIKNGEKQNIDGFTCYVINADELLEIHIFDIIKVNYNGKFFCIPLV